MLNKLIGKQVTLQIDRKFIEYNFATQGLNYVIFTGKGSSIFDIELGQK